MSIDAMPPDHPTSPPGSEHAQILARVMALSHEAIVTTRLDGIVISWSRGAERMYGFPADEMTGQSIRATIPTERSSELGSILDRVSTGGAVEDVATVRRTKNGDLLDVRLNVMPIQDDTGRVVSALMVARDVTWQRRTETALLESEGRWKAVITSAVDAVVVIDAKGTIEVFNPAAERLFGYTANEVVGRNITMLMPAPYRDEHDRYLEEYLRTGHRKIIGIGREVVGRRRDGSTFAVHLSVGEMRLGDERHFTGILHDLTPRLQLEARVREQNALARLGEMAAVIAHEVKNPLAAVRGAIQVIGRRLPAGSTDAPVVDEIIARIDALTALLKDLLLFARTPQPRLTTVDLVSLLRRTAEFLAKDPVFGGHPIAFEGTAGPMTADPELLTIVFQNLMLNAAQAMQGRGTVSIRLTAEDTVQRVTVTDNGPGLSPEALTNLFRPFFTTKSRGTGLGLATAKRLVEVHAGSIAVESVSGSGTTVTVSLPVTPVASDAEGAPADHG